MFKCADQSEAGIMTYNNLTALFSRWCIISNHLQTYSSIPDQQSTLISSASHIFFYHDKKSIFFFKLLIFYFKRLNHMKVNLVNIGKKVIINTYWSSQSEHFAPIPFNFRWILALSHTSSEIRCIIKCSKLLQKYLKLLLKLFKRPSS